MAQSFLREIVWHGRGGQGVVVASTIFGAAAAIYEGKHAMSIPSFRAERRGAPVMAFTRISSDPIQKRSNIYRPSIVVIFDDSLFRVATPLAGAVENATVVVNSKRTPAELSIPASLQATTFDATAVALAKLGVPIVNTTMLGVLARVTGLVSLDSLKRAIADVLPASLVERNVAAAEAGYAGAVL